MLFNKTPSLKEEDLQAEVVYLKFDRLLPQRLDAFLVEKGLAVV